MTVGALENPALNLGVATDDGDCPSAARGISDASRCTGERREGICLVLEFIAVEDLAPSIAEKPHDALASALTVLRVRIPNVAVAEPAWLIPGSFDVERAPVRGQELGKSTKLVLLAFAW